MLKIRRKNVSWKNIIQLLIISINRLNHQAKKKKKLIAMKDEKAFLKNHVKKAKNQKKKTYQTEQFHLPSNKNLKSWTVFRNGKCV